VVSDRVQDDREEKKEVPVQMRKRITLLIAALTMALTMSFGSVAFADPAFGPGNKGGGEGNSGPQGAKCHAPGQEKGTPGCK
jgi:hypothetical protein